MQFKQCEEYAKRELNLDEDYTFLEYEDKGLSGYYSDRPDFQRMLHDIEMGKIRAVVCYKLDRIGRKTSDLLRLLDFLEKHKVDLLNAPTISIQLPAYQRYLFKYSPSLPNLSVIP